MNKNNYKCFYKMSGMIFERQNGEIKKYYLEKDFSKKINYVMNDDFVVFKNDFFMTEEIEDFSKRKNIALPKQYHKITFFKSSKNYKKSLYLVFIFDNIFYKKIIHLNK